jgi:glutamate-5-semialdehyde dehydrogenase
MILADDEAFNQIQKFYPLTLLHHSEPSDYGQEFLSYKLAIKTVDDFNHALKHIREYSSGHSEAIIAEENETINEYFQRVDAAVLYANASTAFTDGGEFGMGGEIGISTQKLHVRGPFSLQHLVSSKWLVKGSGQTRD